MIEVHAIKGGIHPPEEKALSNPGHVINCPMPPRIILPLNQHIGAAAEPLVAVGQQVLGGECLATAKGLVSANVHAPTSGVIASIDDHPVPHASGLSNCCIELIPDGEDKWKALSGTDNYRQATPADLVSTVRSAGISGMGGAGFPTAVKLMASDRTPINTLIINGTECEPYITADDTLMQVDPAGIIEGAEILAFIVGAERILFAVEDNKPEAAAALTRAVAESASPVSREVVTFPTKYPSGGEKQLIEILTGQQVPSGKLPADLGIVCQNTGTAVAVRDAVVAGKPLTHRIVTLTGRALTKPANYRVPLGTPIEFLLSLAGYQAEQSSRLVHGGPMMGFAIDDPRIPVIKTTNCVLAPTEQEFPSAPSAQACIRCGHCAEACPASLLPQQLYWYARARDQEQLERHNLFDCIECGACAWVCPSHIPLVQYYRAAKGFIQDSREEKIRSERSQARFEARQARVDREAQAREAKRAARKAAAQAKATQDSEEDPIQAAVARAKARKSEHEVTD